jgi:hypothetical protein
VMALHADSAASVGAGAAMHSDSCAASQNFITLLH